MLNTVNFVFSFLILIFMIGNGFVRRAEGLRSASILAFALGALALVVCLWNYVVSTKESSLSPAYPSGQVSQVLTRLDSLNANIRSLRQDVDVVQRRVWYLTKGREPEEVLRLQADSQRVVR